jgi:hypothetical protein
VTVEARPVGERDRGERHERHRDRDRDRDRGERHRDRSDRRDRNTEREERPSGAFEAVTTGSFEAVASEPEAIVGTEAAPAVETHVESPTKVDDIARAALDRKSKRDAKRSGPTTETREFWETWAAEKSTREPAAEETAEASEPAESEERPARSRDKGGRDKRDKDRGRDKGGRGDKRAKSDTKVDKPEKKEKEEGGRGKRDTAYSAPPAMDGAQARLFVSLGKKHGVSADDLRELLANAIGGDKSRIGSVSLRDSHAHVRVPEDLADKIIEGVNNTKHEDHDVTVERSRA